MSEDPKSYGTPEGEDMGTMPEVHAYWAEYVIDGSYLRYKNVTAQVKALEGELSEALHDISRHVQICAEQANRIVALERDLEAARRERDRYKEALEWVKRDCEVCNWHCDNCGRDYGMTETDLYAETSRALSQPTPQAGEE